MSKKFNKNIASIIITTSILGLSGCSFVGKKTNEDGPPLHYKNVSKIPDAIPKVEPKSKIGNPKTYEVFNKRYHVLPTNLGYEEVGTASWYGRKFHGRRTSNGEVYDVYGMTAAHKSLPLPTYAKVKNLENGREVVVKINDRGPFVDNRIIDLSYAAAKKLGMHNTGTAKVKLTAINPNNHKIAVKKRYKSKKSSPVYDIGSNDYSRNKLSRGENLYLQLGAFSEKHNADKLADKAVNLVQQNVWVKDGLNPSPNLYKVRIGPLKNLEEARQLKEKLASSDITTSTIVTRN